jgi:hypothetical protein
MNIYATEDQILKIICGMWKTLSPRDIRLVLLGILAVLDYETEFYEDIDFLFNISWIKTDDAF